MTTIATNLSPRRGQQRGRFSGSGLRSAFSPRDVLFVLFRHKRKVMFTFASVALLTTAAALLLPPKYVSEAQMRVGLGRESVSIDPTATIGQTTMPMQNRDVELNSELETLRSREVAEAVAQQIGPATLMSDRRATLTNAVDALQKDVELSITPGTVNLKIIYGAQSPDMAQRVVAAYIEAFLELRLRVYRNRDSQLFFSQQHARALTDLNELQGATRDFKDRTGVADLTTQRTILLNRIGTLETQVNAARAELAAAEATVKYLALAYTEAPERLVTSRTTGSPLSSIETLRQKLFELKLEEQDLSARYVEDSPTVIAKRATIAQAEAMLAVAERDGQETISVNRVREELGLNLDAEKATVAATTAKLDQFIPNLEAARGGLARLNEAQIELSGLERRTALAEANVRRYAEKLEEVRIGQALEQDKITNISVIDPASLPDKPGGTSPKILIVIGIMLAGVCAGGVAFAAEAIDHTVRRPEDLAKLGGRPDTTLVNACVSISKLRSGTAIARGAADRFDELAHALQSVFGDAGQQGSRVAADTGRRTRGFFRSSGYILQGTIRGVFWALGVLLIAIGNATISVITWPVGFFRQQPVTSSRPAAAAINLDDGSSSLGGDGLIVEYEEIRDEDLGESDRPEPKAAPERHTGRSLRLLVWSARREMRAWWRRDERANLQLSDRRHRTAAGTALWRAARGLVEQIVLEGEANGTGDRVPPTIAVVAARPDSGASTVAAHLAAVIAERVIESPDVRNGELADKKPALLLQIVETTPGVQMSIITQGEGGVDRLTDVEASSVAGLDRVVLKSVRTAEVRQTIAIARRSYRHVILDVPPVFSDLGGTGSVQGVREEAGPRLAALCETSVLVLESARLRREAAGRALERLERAGAVASVTVLNKRDYPVPQWIYKRA